MATFTDRLETLHSEALKKVREILQNLPNKTADTFAYDDLGNREAEVSVIFEAADYGTYSVNCQHRIFAVKLDTITKDDPYDYLQILVRQSDTRTTDTQEPCDFTDDYGVQYKWILHPDHFYFNLLEIADYLVEHFEKNDK